MFWRCRTGLRDEPPCVISTTASSCCTVIGDCYSASFGEDERMQRPRRYAIRTVLSAVAEAGISELILRAQE
jgi:hypothetical protein